MIPTELQARLLFELLQESSQTKHIQLSVTLTSLGPNSLAWFAHLVSPTYVSLLGVDDRLLQCSPSYNTLLSQGDRRAVCLLASAEDRFGCQNFLDLFLTLVGTSAAPSQ